MKNTVIERENIFQMVNTKDWKELIEVFKNNDHYDYIMTDPILKTLIETYFIEELLNTPNIDKDINYKYYLTNFYSLHTFPKWKFKLSNNDYKKLIIKIVEVEKNIESAYNYAILFPEEPICKTTITEYKDLLPNIIEHSQNKSIHVTQNKNIRSVDASMCLFKSIQEYHFYRAVREVYQSFLVLPNVAMNAVLNFEMINSDLSATEKNYFFTGLIDCVVIDTENNFKPVMFFELDSVYHDDEKQISKDKLKDNILSIAGQKLIRIRRTSVKNDEKDFVKLIRELIR